MATQLIIQQQITYVNTKGENPMVNEELNAIEISTSNEIIDVDIAKARYEITQAIIHLSTAIAEIERGKALLCKYDIKICSVDTNISSNEK